MSDVMPAARAALQVASDFARQSMASATMRAYAGDWARFQAWCAGKGLTGLPAEPRTVAAFLASMAETHAPNTITRHLTSISRMHKLNGVMFWPSHPTITETLKGLLRTHGRATKKAAPVGVESIRAMVATCGESARDRRDRCLLILGFGGAFRRSELVALRIEDITIRPEGLRILIRRSKTDQIGAGAEIGIPAGSNPETCAVRALAAWLAVLGVTSGPLFRSIRKDGWFGPGLAPYAVWTILAHRARLAGLEAIPRPHGLRAGFITAAYEADVRDDDIMAHTRHRDLKTMRGYVRRARLLSHSPAGRVGL